MSAKHIETEAIQTQIDRSQFLEHSNPLYLTSSYVFMVSNDLGHIRHVQRHGADGGRKGHNPRSAWEGNAEGEAGVAVAAGADGVGQKHPV